MTRAEASAFLVIDNAADAPVALLDVRSPDADSVVTHAMAGGRMHAIARVDIPARGRLVLAPGGYHLMLRGLHRRLVAGDSVTLDLHFDPGGVLEVRAPVVRYTDAVGGLPHP